MYEVDVLEHLNAGLCADIYIIDSQKVLKLYKEGWSKETVYQEYVNTRAANQAGIASPKVYEFVEQSDRFGFVMERLADMPLLVYAVKNPFRFLSFARKMSELHIQIHKGAIPEEIPFQYKQYSDWILGTVSLSHEEQTFLLDCLSQLSVCNETSLCHGDFHPFNILVDQGRYLVIDWVLATQGDACADVAGTYLIMCLMASEIAEESALLKYTVARVCRKFADVYLNRYMKLSGRSREDIIRWIPIRAASYIDRDLPASVNRKLCQIVKKAMMET